MVSLRRRQSSGIGEEAAGGRCEHVNIKSGSSAITIDPIGSMEARGRDVTARSETAAAALATRVE